MSRQSRRESEGDENWYLKESLSFILENGLEFPFCYFIALRIVQLINFLQHQFSVKRGDRNNLQFWYDGDNEQRQLLK